jgi:hypothetical protein
MASLSPEELWALLSRNRDRLQWIADQEARGAWTRSGAADGRFGPEREKLIAEADQILDRLEKLYKSGNQS